MSYHGYLAMILPSVPCIMICHDLDKGTMVNHDLARLTMIMASVPWLRTLGRIEQLQIHFNKIPEPHNLASYNQKLILLYENS